MYFCVKISLSVPLLTHHSYNQRKSLNRALFNRKTPLIAFSTFQQLQSIGSHLQFDACIEVYLQSRQSEMSITSSTMGGKIKYKIVLLGDQHVGKTSIIDRFINDRFQSSYNATIGIDFLVRNITYQNKNYRLQLWDTAGQQRFKSLIPSYLKDSNICILVYDLSIAKSLQNAEKWLQLYNQHKQQTAFSVLVGNKKDITNRQCTPEMIEKALQKMKETNHFQISAKTGEGVTDLFYKIIDLIGNRLNNIKIIDQIDEKEDKLEKEAKDEVADTAKPSISEHHTSVKLVVNPVEEPKQKKACC